MKKIISLAIMAITLLPTTASAEDNDNQEFKAKAGIDFVSHYMWRGTDMADFSIQPELGISWKGLSLTAAASTGFKDDDVEDIDVTLNYSRWGFNIGVIDYWTKDVDEKNRYFYYDSHGPHQLEANLGYTCKYFSLQAYTMFAGNDFKINGDRAYSTYIELAVPFKAGGLNWDARVGISPMESSGTTTTRTVQGLVSEIKVTDKIYQYGEGFTCNMVSVRATKTFEFKYFKLPIFAEIHANPYLQKAYLLAGVTIATF